MSTTFVVAYLRFSSKAQAQGHSELRQEGGLASYLERTKGTLLETYWDRGESAYDGAHRSASFGKLLADCAERKYPTGTIIYIEDMDRFSRGKLYSVLADWQVIIDGGYTIHVDGIGMDFDANTNQMTTMPVIIKAIVAHEESEKKQTRLKKVWAEKRQNAGMTKNKFGKVSGTCPSWMKVNEQGTAYEFNERADVIRVAVQMALTGAGVEVIQGRLGQIAGLLNIFKNVALYGYRQNCIRIGKKKREKDGLPVPAYYDVNGNLLALISESDYASLQSSIKSRRNNLTGRGGDEVTCLFTGMLFNEKGMPLVVNRQSRDNKAVLVAKVKGFKQIYNDVVEKDLLWLLKSTIKPSDFSGESTIDEDTKQLLNVESQIKSLQIDCEQWEKDIQDKISQKLLRVGLEKLETLQSEKQTLLVKVQANHAGVVNDAQNIASELNNLPKEERISARLKLKSILIPAIIKRIEIEIHSSYDASYKITLANGKILKTNDIVSFAEYNLRT